MRYMQPVKPLAATDLRLYREGPKEPGFQNSSHLPTIDKNGVKLNFF